MLCMCICSNTFFNDFITINNNLNQFLLRRLVLFLIFLYFLLLPPTPTAATWLHWLLLRRREKQPKYLFHQGNLDGDDDDKLSYNVFAMILLRVPGSIPTVSILVCLEDIY